MSGHCKEHFNQMRYKKTAKFKVMVIEHCGSYDLDTPIEILVRLYLTLFAEKPFSFALFLKLKDFPNFLVINLICFSLSSKQLQLKYFLILSILLQFKCMIPYAKLINI
jgi:hypothetical protein